MSPKFAATLASLSIAAACAVGAQPAGPPARETVESVVLVCRDCGTIESIQEVAQTRAVAPPSAAPALPIGLVMYIPLGRNPNGEKAYVGSVGTREWQERTAGARYEFTVRMNDGSYRSIPRQGVSDFTIGDRVKVSQFNIEHSMQ